MSAARQILVVEDDTDIAEMLDLSLRSEGFAVSVAGSGEEALERLRAQRFDLMLLDLMLPGIDGLAICRRVRALEDYVPIIIVSARADESHRVRGLDLGADDYLGKPFSVPELTARVHAVLRRMQAAERASGKTVTTIRHGALSIDAVARTVHLGERDITLTTKEFDLLTFFARHPGRAFSRIELLDSVWGYSHEGYEHTVNTHINRLRGKIEQDPAAPQWILTVWGVGYKFTDRAPTG